MIVTYYGKQYFKIQLGERTIAYNPIGKDSKEKGSRFGADIVLSSLRHPDFNGAEQCSVGTREPFVISGPGEYEVGGIFIKGFGTETTYADENLPATAYRSKEAVGRGQAGKINTVFSVMFEGINLCFLGSLASSDALSREVKEGLGEIDVLFAPIGGGDMLSASDAYKLTLAVDAKVVIPMDYEHTKGSLETFIKEGGANAETMEKFTFKRKDLDGKEGAVVVLTSA